MNKVSKCGLLIIFFFQAEDGIRDADVTGVQTVLFRSENPELFREGNYESLNFGGAFADCAIGFVRRRGDRAIIAIVPRLSSRVGFLSIGERWQDTHVVLPSTLSNLRDVFCDREVRAENSQLRLAMAMSQLPFAILEN